MDVFVMVRRQNMSAFLDASESTTILQVKKMVRGITQREVEEIRLLKDSEILEDHKTLQDYGFTSSTARAQIPATIGLVFKKEDGEFEELDIHKLSTPPELPDVMKPQESSSHTQEQASV